MIRPQYTAMAQIVIETGRPNPATETQRRATGRRGDRPDPHYGAHLPCPIGARAQQPLGNIPLFVRPGRRRRAASGGSRPLYGTNSARHCGTGSRGLAASVACRRGTRSIAAEAEALRLDRFQHSLKVSQEGGSLVIAVAFKASSPGHAALAANRVVQLYVKSEDERKRAQVNRVVSWLNERIPTVEAGFKQAETAVQNYRVAHGLADPDRTDLSDQKLADLTRQLISAEIRSGQASGRAGLRRRPAPVSLWHRPLARGRRLAGRRRAAPAGRCAAAIRGRSRSHFGQESSEVQQLDAQLQEVRHKLSDETGRAISGLTSEARIAGDQVTAIRKQISELQAAGSQAQEAEPRLNELEREAAAAGQVYQGLLQRRRAAPHAAGNDAARPAHPLTRLAAGSTQFLQSTSLHSARPDCLTIGGSLLAVAAERLQKGMRSAQDVNDALGIPCVGFVPLIRHSGKVRPHQYLLANPFAAYTE